MKLNQFKKIEEPLTGRKNTIKMFPISQIELNNNENYLPFIS